MAWLLSGSGQPKTGIKSRSRNSNPGHPLLPSSSPHALLSRKDEMPFSNSYAIWRQSLAGGIPR